MFFLKAFFVKYIYIVICKLVKFVKLIIKFTPHIIINTDNIFFRLTSSLNMKWPKIKDNIIPIPLLRDSNSATKTYCKAVNWVNEVKKPNATIK